MSGQRGNPFMKKAQPQSRDWFRIENAHKDEENATDELTKVYIYGEIGDSWWGDSTSANDFIKLISGVKSSKIELHLNSPGGSIFDGIAIYNALRQHDAEVHVIVDALAASAASFIAQAGDTVTMTKAATMMIHDGSTGAYGDAAYLRETADILDKLSNTVAGIYADRSGDSTEFWRNLMIQEVWYNADEAVAAGLADEVEGDTAEDDLQDATNKWDLSIYNHEGRAAAPDPLALRRRIANQLKEVPVTGAKNTADEPTQTPPGPAAEPEPTTESGNSPETHPDAPTTEGDAAEVQEEHESDNPGAVPDPVPPATAEPNNFVPMNNGAGAIAFMVNGSQTSDPKVVQNRLNMLETFRNETLSQARLDFVENLAGENKIGAPQVDKLQEYAASLTDEQFVAWKATWDAAPALPMLGNHGGFGGTAQSQTEAGDTKNAEIESCKEIVNQHKIGGMKDEVIKNTASYKKLIELDPTFKL